MENAVKRIGVLTSGGDAPGMNACIRAVVRSANARGIECVGIRRGYQGLISGDIVEMDNASVSRIINRGGTILYSARCDEFRTKEGRKKAYATCKLLGLDGLVAIGGDGTFRGAQDLSKFGVSVVGIPGTIDNDIVCTDYTIGFDTAANTAVECMDKLRDTMQSHERCSVVEVMGHRAGYLALYVGVAIGATAVLVPERSFDFEKHVAEKIRRARLSGKTNYMIVVAEGAASGIAVGEQIQKELGLDPPRDHSGPHPAGRQPHSQGPRHRHPDGLRGGAAAGGGRDEPHRLHHRGADHQRGHRRGPGHDQDPEPGGVRGHDRHDRKITKKNAPPARFFNAHHEGAHCP